jgi:hypothetical protein
MDYAIRTYSNRIEAESAEEHLRTNGIESYIQADDAGGAIPSMAFTGRVLLFVSEKDKRRAEDLLKEHP